MSTHIWHPYTRFSALAAGPLPRITGGQGIYLQDDQGRRYVDAIASWWCCTLGHGHPRLIEAIQRQAGELQHSILGNLSHPRAEELAERLCRTLPTPDRHMMFASDGSCAVDAALKMAVQYFWNRGVSGKSKFLTLEQDYHGDTIGAVSVGFVPGFHDPFRSLLRDGFTVPLPDYERGAGLDPTRRLLEAHHAEIAAVIVEPLCQGSAGMRMYPARWLSEVAQLCREYDVLLIVDEIAMGFGRTGQYWAFEHAGIDPDIVCVGKGITSGYLPISAAVCRDAIYETFSDVGDRDCTFYHGHTFCGNPIAAACALETLAVYDELDIAARARRMGSRMEDHLRRLAGRAGVKDLRFLGLIGVLELEPVPESAARAVRVREALKAEGVLIRPLGDVFYLMPPLIITETELDELCNRFVAALERELE